MRWFSLWIAACLAQNWTPTHITLYRDSLGIAHIWAPTDAEAAYGAGWAQAEDIPIPLQENLLAARGQLGRRLGKGGTLWDFLLYFTGTDTLNVRRGLDERTWQLLEGFAAGLNAYFAAHPEKQLYPELFPVTADDIARGTHLILNAMAGLGRALQWLRRGLATEIPTLVEGYGSNAFAVAPHRIADGTTWLLINSHQPLTGRFAWYELHVGSAEGWNISGGTFPGGVFPFVGTNPSLGWAHTFAYHQLTDLYALEVRRGRYRYGSTWLPLERRRVRLYLKGLQLPRRVYRTAFGPALKVRGRWYALSQLALRETGALAQWYAMSRARNLHTFQEALSRLAVPTFNTVYADEEGHIALFSWIQLPDRDTTLSWGIPTSSPQPAHRLEGAVPAADLPTVLDPPCGYVYNANQTPLQATCSAYNWKPRRQLIGLQRFTYNRGERLSELWTHLEGKPISFETLRSLKHDRCIASEGSYRRVFAPLFSLDSQRYPRLAEPIQALQKWKGCAEPEDTLTALVMVTHAYLEQRMQMRLAEALILGYQPTESEVVWALTKASRVLRKHYGTLYPQWQAVLRHGRGGVEVGVGGFPESLESRHWRWEPKPGRFRVTGGDGLIYWVGWQEGQQRIYAIQPYGASEDPKSPHHTDQVRAFAAGQLFPRTLDWEQIATQAKRAYHPKPSSH